MALKPTPSRVLVWIRRRMHEVLAAGAEHNHAMFLLLRGIRCKCRVLGEPLAESLKAFLAVAWKDGLPITKLWRDVMEYVDEAAKHALSLEWAGKQREWQAFMDKAMEGSAKLAHHLARREVNQLPCVVTTKDGHASSLPDNH
eukprot:11387144-Prorocentrum_lima.AAC.1